jgi:hypothetical protein
MAAPTRSAVPDAELVSGVAARAARELTLVLGRDLHIAACRAERAGSRPAGQGCVHVSFKLGFARAGAPVRYGALLVPLPDAITMACCLLMIPDEELAARREETAPDEGLKDALLEIGNMLGTSVNGALADLGIAGWTVRSEGCQGVRAGVRPAFPYEEGSPLVVGRVSAALESFPPFELLLLLPAVD